MKKLIFIKIIFISFLLITGCSKKDGTPTDPFGTGNGDGNGKGDGSVNITITSRNEQGNTIFSATPNAAITLSKLTVSVPAEQYNESFQFDGTTVVNANDTEDLIEYPAGSGVASGQQWTFQFEGTLAATNKTYNVTSNYTIP